MANGINGNGMTRMAWDWFWRFLSVIVVPWAFLVTNMLVQARDHLSELKVEIRVQQEIVKEIRKDLDTHLERELREEKWHNSATSQKPN